MTQDEINKLAAADKLIRVWDNGKGAVSGLHYIINPKTAKFPMGKRIWALAYDIAGGSRQQHKIADGAVPLKQARVIASAWLADAAKGIDPHAARKTKPEEPVKCLTLREIIDLYIEYLSMHAKPDSPRRTRQILMIFKDFLDKPVTVITKAAVDKLQQYWLTTPSQRTGRPLSPQTINRRTAALWPCLDWAATRGYCPPPDCRVKRLRKTQPKERRHLVGDERMRLHIALAQEAGSYLPYIVKFALNTGIRTGTLLHLRWEDFNMQAHTLHLRGEIMKGGTDWTIPLNGIAFRTIVQWQKASGRDSGYVFPDNNSDGIINYRKLRDNFCRIVKRAGIKDFTFYCLRHSFATDLIRQNVNVLLVQKLMCHTKIEMTLVYAHVDDNQLAEAVDTLTGLYTPKK